MGMFAAHEAPVVTHFRLGRDELLDLYGQVSDLNGQGVVFTFFDGEAVADAIVDNSPYLQPEHVRLNWRTAERDTLTP